ncbi:uncharacterized protein TNCT_65261 [Trichonephila clavata]|uniref:Uncharacterized protein n=1 Tax=Trichonephila clavata TaxID=2740835 RepID=A0A8X6JK32_TRICU|nr:uncharacterized protein TNCT_65261 [Trichonephila clavata]
MCCFKALYIFLISASITLSIFAIDNDISKDFTGRTAHAGYFDNFHNRLPYEQEFEKFFDSSYSYPEFSKVIDSNKLPRYDVPSGFKDFVPDESTEDKYSYSPGGFYLPSSKKTKMNYFVEEVKESDNNDRQSSNGEIITSTTTDESNKDLPNKGTKVLTGSNSIDTEIAVRPTFLSFIRKILLNPLVSSALVMIPLTLIAEMILPYFTNFFGSNMAPVFASTIASGFARSLDVNSALHVEQILDTINEYGARTLEDPRCFQRFLCQGAKSYFESRSGDPWNIHKVIRKLAKTVDDRVWGALGLKHLLNSVQNGSCESIVCSGTVAYKQDLSLMEKLQLLSTKFFKPTEVVY